MKSVFVLSVLLLGGVTARSLETNHVEDESGRNLDNGDSYSTSSLLGDFRHVYRVYSECAAQDLSSCLKLKLVTALDRASRSLNDLKITDGLSFVRDPSVEVPQDGPKTEQELEAELPRSLVDKEDSLDGMIVDKILNFMKSHTVQMKFPSAEDLQRSLSEDGRGKKGKLGGLLLLPLMMAAMMIPLALGGLALLAGKALLVSKLALVLSAIIGLKKLLSGSGGGHESSYQVVSVPGGGGHHYGRSLQGEAAQQLAYRAYAPSAPVS
ncbi:uncharacterized protein Osi8 [Anabrus simplex]|uniref:uncharacterized protein Osi8 n=1 Tax=Anabrus simplex TaxID=316456 RepID=UPI0035A2F5B5